MSAQTPEIEFLTARWQRSGVRTGDVLLLHSNIIRTFAEARRAGFVIGVNEILDALLLMLGVEGTLLLPLFNFDFTRGVPFDIRNTPSHMGALTEAARKRPGAVRTGHPVYSFCAIGRDAEVFRGVDNRSGYGSDSPFGILREMHGKIAALDLDDQQCMTFYHHIEEMNGVDYRYHKTFAALYTDADGVTSERSYTIFVRDLERGVVTHVNPAGEQLWA